MSIMGVLNTAVSGLMTSQTGLRIVANNIANLNTPGYAREVARQENIVTSGVSAGVQIADIERIVDRFLQAAGLDASSRSAAAETVSQFNDRFQGLLGRPDSQGTIAARITRLFGVIANLAIDPANSILRQATLASFQDLGDEINRISGAIQNLKNDASQRIQEQVISVNEAIRRIHEINPMIARQRAISGETAGLENRRGQALSDLAGLIDIRISRNSDGTIGIATASGSVLLDSSRRELEYTAPGVVTSETLFSPIRIWQIDSRSDQRIGTPRDFDHLISSGSLRGLLDLRDNELRDLSLTLGELSAKLIDQINAIHNAHSPVPAPNQMVGRNTGLADQTHLFTGTTTFAIVDANNQVVNSFTLDLTTVTRFIDIETAVNAGLGLDGTLTLANGVMSFTATDPTHGVVIADDPADPTDRGGRGFSHFFGMNDLLEAAVEVNYNTGLVPGHSHNFLAGGEVTFELRDDSGRFLTQYTLDPAAAGVSFNDILNDLNGAGALGRQLVFSLDAQGAMTITPQPGFDGVRIAVINDTTDLAGNGVSFTQLFGVGDRYQVDPSKRVQVVESIRQQPQKMALVAFDLTAAVGVVALSAGDQSGALAFQSLETAVIQFNSAGDLASMSASLGQFAAAFYSSAGLKAARAEARAEDQKSFLTEINLRIADVSGVNLNEELANMIVLQNSFNAAARLITTSQEMFDSLLAAV